jgi:hypothetical protein
MKPVNAGETWFFSGVHLMPDGMIAEGVKRQALSGETFTKSGIGTP